MIKVYGLGPFMPSLKGVVRDVRAIWALEELGLPYEHKIMDAMAREHKRPDYLAINPFGKVPAIQDGDFTLFESGAICGYLVDKTGKLGPKAGTKERALFDQWNLFTLATLEPHCARVFGIDFFQKEKDPVSDKIRSDALGFVDGMYTALNKELEGRPYLLGQDFTMPDLILSCTARFVAHTELQAKHPKLDAYLKKNYERPAFKKAYSLHD